MTTDRGKRSFRAAQEDSSQKALRGEWKWTKIENKMKREDRK
jgi:hypothetical protein